MDGYIYTRYAHRSGRRVSLRNTYASNPAPKRSCTCLDKASTSLPYHREQRRSGWAGGNILGYPGDAYEKRVPRPGADTAKIITGRPVARAHPQCQINLPRNSQILGPDCERRPDLRGGLERRALGAEYREGPKAG